MDASLLDGVLDNAIFYFPQGNGIITIDPLTGNPEEGENLPLEVTAMVKQRKLFVEQDQRQVGTDTEQVSVFGRLISPPVIGLSQVDRKEPIRAVVNGQPCRMLFNSVVDSPAIVALDLSELVGEAFTGRLIYDQ
jgi:hypothetical protein